MRIIQAHKYYYLRAGAERYMLGLSKLLEEQGHTVAPFAMQYPKNLPTPWDEFFVSEIKTQGIGRGFGAVKQFTRALWSSEAKKKIGKLLDVFEPDIVHAHNLYTHLSPSVLAACNARNIPVVMTIHDYAFLSANYALWAGEDVMDLSRLGIFSTAKTRFIKNSYLATFALSFIQRLQFHLNLYDRYINHYFVSSNFMQDLMIENGFKKDKISIERLFLEDMPINAQQDEGYILCVGRLEKYKGVHTLIEVMKDYPNANLKIAGTGEYESELRSLAKGMKNVEFLGFVSGAALWNLMAKARVAVVPSIWYEPFGLVAMEAMSQATPVITSDRGGLAEIVEEGISGTHFKAGNVDHLSSVLKEFIHDPSHAASMGEAARVRANQISNPHKHVERIIDRYKRLIEK